MGKTWRQFISSGGVQWAGTGGLLGGLLLSAESCASWLYGRMQVDEFYWNSALLYPLLGAVLGWLSAAVLAGCGLLSDSRLKLLPLFFVWLQGVFLHSSFQHSWAGELIWLALCLSAGLLLSRVDWRRSRKWPWLGGAMLYWVPAFALACNAMRRDLWVVEGSLLVQVMIEGGLLCLLLALAARLSRWRVEAGSPRLALSTAVALAALGGVIPAGMWLVPAVSSAEADSGRMTPRPNIVVIVVDTLRADRLSSYGYSRLTSPNLDHFASQGTLYRRAFSPGNWTLPAHASLFTGRFPRSHGAHRSGLGAERADVFPLAEYEVTLAEVLDARGYRTGAVVANHLWVRGRYGLAQGFDDWAAKPPSSGHLLAQVSRMLQRHSPQHRLSFLSETVWKSQRHPVRRAPEINGMALRWIDQRNSHVPFLLFLNYMDVHSPRRPPAPFRDLFPGRLEETVGVKSGLRDGSLKSSAALRRHLDSQYDGSVAYWDHHFGRLTASLQERRLLGNTLFVITSDHGEYLGEHGLTEHEIGVGEAMTHVPLIIRWPGQASGSVVEEQVQLTDILPTVLDVLGLPSHPAVQGRSLRPGRQVPRTKCPSSKARGAEGLQMVLDVSLVRDCASQELPAVSKRQAEAVDEPPSLGRPAYLQHYGEHRIARWFEGRFRFDQRALRAGPWTLIVSENGRRELIRSGDEDPQKDLSQQFPQVAQDLLRRLQEMEAICKPAPMRLRSMSPEAEEALRSLGYL